ncbi:hypothetical protein M885DRAFT_556293 [Pelagophyceae sp. CCMP2097]|nr:hypothetical protein M885DRAFT_556293 [Pelagophyceae sp. CCMP2097]
MAAVSLRRVFSGLGHDETRSKTAKAKTRDPPLILADEGRDGPLRSESKWVREKDVVKAQRLSRRFAALADPLALFRPSDADGAADAAGRTDADGETAPAAAENAAGPGAHAAAHGETAHPAAENDAPTAAGAGLAAAPPAPAPTAPTAPPGQTGHSSKPIWPRAP